MVVATLRPSGAQLDRANDLVAGCRARRKVEQPPRVCARTGAPPSPVRAFRVHAAARRPGCRSQMGQVAGAEWAAGQGIFVGTVGSAAKVETVQGLRLRRSLIMRDQLARCGRVRHRGDMDGGPAPPQASWTPHGHDGRLGRDEEQAFGALRKCDSRQSSVSSQTRTVSRLNLAAFYGAFPPRRAGRATETRRSRGGQKRGTSASV